MAMKSKIRPKKTNTRAAKPKATAKARPEAKPPAKAAKLPRSGTPDSKATYLKFVDEVLNGGNFSVAASYLTDDVKTHNGFPDQEPGLTGFVAALKAFHGAFPDIRAHLTHAVAEGDLVVGRFEVTGTHRGPFLGMPATGRKVRYEEIAIVRMAEGKIAEHWSVADALAIMQQLQTSEIG
jgi:predicted ester cyclase